MLWHSMATFWRPSGLRSAAVLAELISPSNGFYGFTLSHNGFLEENTFFHLRVEDPEGDVITTFIYYTLSHHHLVLFKNFVRYM